jgi:uncharacterized OsmC-like protein
MESTSTDCGQRKILSRRMQMGLFPDPDTSRLSSGTTATAPSRGVTDGQEVTGDEPERYGGSGVGITPEDMLLTAVGHCLAATYIGGLSAAGIAVKSLQIDVSGRVNFRAAYGLEAANPGFEGIRVEVDIQADSSPDKVKEVLDRLLKTAPIPDTIIRPLPLDVEISCRQTELAADLS